MTHVSLLYFKPCSPLSDIEHTSWINKEASISVQEPSMLFEYEGGGCKVGIVYLSKNREECVKSSKFLLKATWILHVNGPCAKDMQHLNNNLLRELLQQIQGIALIYLAHT